MPWPPSRRRGRPELPAGPGAPGPEAGRWRRLVTRPVSRRWRLPLLAASCVVFLAVLFLRGGPNPAETDAHAVTLPATAISHGDLRLAEQETYVPNPPGYPLLTAPLVAALRPWVGAPRWCDDKPIPALLRGAGAAYYRSILDPCRRPSAASHGAVAPVWYRSQALLVVLAWMVLAAGAVLVLRSAGAGRSVGELVLVAALLLLPATTDGVAQSFHPQDLMCVGFSCAGVALALRRRWAAAGALFGAAFVCKQFALLPLVAVLAATPGWRERLRVLLPAAGVAAAAVLPFAVVDPVATGHALTGTYVEGVGVVKTPTVVGLLAVQEHTKLELARDLPVLLAAGLALVARRRAGPGLLTPVALVGVVLACLAGRLVFEVSILDYYFLAVGALLLVADAVRGRFPWWSASWIVATRFGVTWLGGRAPSWVTAAALAVVALLPVALGLGAVPRRAEAAPPAPLPVAAAAS